MSEHHQTSLHEGFRLGSVGVLFGGPQVGYREDRTATALLECQGTYKSQHDTHKGIRTVQVLSLIHI